MFFLVVFNSEEHINNTYLSLPSKNRYANMLIINVNSI